jgi:2-phospho-L-lactate guanylyltransferase
VSGSRQTCWAIIPVKAPGEGKTRLAGVLDSHGRNRLIFAMLERVVGAAHACAAIDRVCLVSPSAHSFEPSVIVLHDEGGGLNAALEAALRKLPAPSPDRVVIVAADLPALSSQDLDLFTDLPAHVIGIAPDRHGTGTNALSLPFAAAQTFAFHFGLGSYAAHKEEARSLGYSVETMLSEGLEKDIDEPDDLADAKGHLQEAL